MTTTDTKAPFAIAAFFYDAIFVRNAIKNVQGYLEISKGALKKYKSFAFPFGAIKLVDSLFLYWIVNISIFGDFGREILLKDLNKEIFRMQLSHFGEACGITDFSPNNIYPI